VGRDKEDLPAEIANALREAGSPYVSCSEVVLWNAGNQTFRRSDIAAADPLRVVIAPKPSTRIVRFFIGSAIHEANSFSIEPDPEHPNVGLCTFDYLAPGDGVRLKIFATGIDYGVHLSGTVAGQRIWNLGAANLCGGTGALTSRMAHYSPFINITFAVAIWFELLVVLSILVVRHPHDLFFRLFSHHILNSIQLFGLPIFGWILINTGIVELRALRGRFPRGLSNA